MLPFAGLALLSLFALTVANISAQHSTTPSQWPLQDNGMNDVVQWDHYSFHVNGKRLFVFSGEIHCQSSFHDIPSVAIDIG